MSFRDPLPPERLYRACRLDGVKFATSDELKDLDEAFGQDRAVDAVRFGVGLDGPGYNLFAMGPPETGKHSVLLRALQRRAQEEDAPPDVCYAHDFTRPHRPKALVLPAGDGGRLARDLQRLVEDLLAAIPAALESEEQRSRKQSIEEDVKEGHEHALKALHEKALTKGIALLHAPMGFAFAPVRDGEILPPEEYEKLPARQRKRLEKDTEELQHELQDALAQLRSRAREARDRVREMLRELTMGAVGHHIEELRQRWAEQPAVVEHLTALEADVIDNVGDFLRGDDAPQRSVASLTEPGALAEPAPLRRYLINVLVDNGGGERAPVVFEDHPTFNNLVGRVEHLSHQGALLSDVHLIRAGALHRANGGYLLLDARSLLTQGLAWDAVKRALKSSEIRIESIGQALSLVSTVSLEPEPVPLDVKIVLVGERLIYYLLDAHDPDFRSLFKVVADFEEDVARDAKAERQQARRVATLVRRHDLLPFDRSAVQRVIEEMARRAGDAERLSTQVGHLEDLLREADHAARERDAELVAAADVDRAVAAERHRHGRVREHLLEQVRRGMQMIDVTGKRVGQVNGLAVLRLGPSDFGRPTRITAKVRLGAGRVIDIEREAKLGGPIHSKGVLILTGFLASRYAVDRPLALSASLVFEQSYGMVDGDSASCAELCALLSALADVPLKQSLAVTGSINQHGDVQPIGGVNEKIEGFFEACQVLGRHRSQGAIIPASNAQHLMLRHDVREAVERGGFAVHAVESVDEALELLTGQPAGVRDAKGSFPAGSVNARVEARLREMAERRASQGRSSGTGGKAGGNS